MSNLPTSPENELMELPKTDKGGNVKSTDPKPYRLNSTATLTCDQGYSYPSRSSSKVILVNGLLKWDPPELNCIPAACFPPSEFDHAKWVPDKRFYYFPDSIQYICEPGYDLLGSTKHQYFCVPSGNWEPPIQTVNCQLNTHWCPELKTPENGKVKFSLGRSFNSEASFSCQKGFRLTGKDNSRKCQEDRTWSGNEITCEPLPTCPKMEGVTFAELAEFNIVICTDNHGKQTSLRVDCVNGQWKYKYPYCNKIKHDTVSIPTSSPSPPPVSNYPSPQPRVPPVSNNPYPQPPQPVSNNPYPQPVSNNPYPVPASKNPYPLPVSNNNVPPVSLNVNQSSFNFIFWVLFPILICVLFVLLYF